MSSLTAVSLLDLPMAALAGALGGSSYPITLLDNVALSIGQDSLGAVRGGLLYSSSAAAILLRSANGTGSSTDILIKTGTATSRGDVKLDGRAIRPSVIDPTAPTAMTVGSLSPMLCQVLPNSTGNGDFVMARAVTVVKAWIVKNATGGGAGDAISLQNGTGGNVIAAFDLSAVTAGGVLEAAALVQAYASLAAGATLRVARTSATNCACTIYLLVVPTEI